MKAVINTLCLAIGLIAYATSGFAADDERVQLDPFTVRADRIEDFGFDLASVPSDTKGASLEWHVRFVVPHTAAAKAGLKPGDRVRKLDGQLVAFRSWREWAPARKKKRDAVAHGGSVTWTLDVQSVGSPDIRTLTLSVPTPPPHWGGSNWRTPEDRPSVRASEAGPLAELAQTVLDNGVWTLFAWPFQQKAAPHATRANPPSLAFTWTIFDEAGQPHKITVSVARGRTDIILAVGTSRAGGNYLTSPTGLLDDAVVWPKRNGRTTAKAADNFQNEIEFWTKRVGKVSPRWPLELRPSNSATSQEPTVAK